MTKTEGVPYQRIIYVGESIPRAYNNTPGIRNVPPRVM